MIKKMLKNFHVGLIYRFQKQFNLSNYSMLWISYIEGILLGFILGIIISQNIDEYVIKIIRRPLP